MNGWAKFKKARKCGGIRSHVMIRICDISNDTNAAERLRDENCGWMEPDQLKEGDFLHETRL
jgi:hypothetical protein